jgi:hypothetical protein
MLFVFVLYLYFEYVMHWRQDSNSTDPYSDLHTFFLICELHNAYEVLLEHIYCIKYTELNSISGKT